MRRFALCALAVLAVGLMLAPGALASTGVKYAVPLGARHAALAPTAATRFAADPVFKISGLVRNFDGSNADNAEVDWGWWNSTGNYGVNYTSGGTSAMTGSTGAFSLSNVTSNSSARANSDDLKVWYPESSSADSSLEMLDSTANDFSVGNDGTIPTSFSYTLQPSEVQVSFTGLGSALENGYPEVWTGGAPGSATTSVSLTNGVGTAFVMPSSFNDVVAGFPTSPFDMTGETQWQGPDTAVAAGVADTTPVSLDWGKAQYATLYGPPCQHSGKPGSIAKLVLRDWPQAEQAKFIMEGYWQAWIYTKALFTSTGVDETYTAQLVVPKTAVDVYRVHAYRSDSGDPNGLLDLYDAYQVCTFKSSAGTIRHGKAVRLSGAVPGTGKVTVYSTTHKVTAQPKTLTPKGWTKMKTTYTVSAKGKFATGLLHPTRTTWYVVKYNGYAFSAYTSVIKVTVH
jgi:hypothetical protein